jgi:hypothetical protein
MDPGAGQRPRHLRTGLARYRRLRIPGGTRSLAAARSNPNRGAFHSVSDAIPERDTPVAAPEHHATRVGDAKHDMTIGIPTTLCP